ncbi:sensor histidine kinase [Macrococcus sp. EM39E]|uniref:sensor histidine kinase n=1 Tax=Macrococcus animalis TaxID=3395467 RepID=UPI0039BF0074
MMHPNQRGLYLMFATSIFILLITFSIITYISTASSINYQLKLKSDNILNSEYKEHFNENSNGLHLDLKNDQEEQSNQIYFITKDNQIIKQPAYQRKLIQKINQTLSHDKEYQHHYIDVLQSHYYVSSKKVILYNQSSVYMYTVFDTTESYHGLSQLKNILTGLTVLYLFLILLMTYFFSKKAMAPLELAVNRQKQFVQDASHELKTPLAVVKAGTEVIEQFDGAQLSDTGKEMITDIKAEVDHMNALVTNLLSLTRLEQDMQIEEVDLSQLITESMHYFQKTHDIKVNHSITSHTIIKGNHQALKRALSILFENAIKYGDKPTVTLYLNNRCLIFSDDGPGVTPKDLPHLFERFYRGNTSQSGTGIGLALFKEIMDQHAATVDVTNDNGLKFTINFR